LFDPRLFDSSSFEKRCFLKNVENQLVEISIQTVVLHLEVFENDLKKLDFG